MFITKKHLSRRTVLKGAGVNLALPFLGAMVPASTALAQTAAAPKIRTGFFYIPHGAIMYNTSHGPAMDRWTPSGSGANFKLSPILASLEPHKKYVTSFGNLENAATAGSVHTFTPATWLSATRPTTTGAVAAASGSSFAGVASEEGAGVPLAACGSLVEGEGVAADGDASSGCLSAGFEHPIQVATKPAAPRRSRRDRGGRRVFTEPRTYIVVLPQSSAGSSASVNDAAG